MTTPHDPDAGRPEAVDHACGLGVVQEHDVAAVDQGEHLGDVGADDPFVAGTLVLAEWTAVARDTMQQVVQAFRDGEELRLAVEHHPSILDLRPTPVRKQRLEHLSDAPTMGRRVDMPDRAIPEGHLSSHRRLRQASRPFRRQDARQQLERQRLDLDLLHPDILARLAEVPTSLLRRCGTPSVFGAARDGALRSKEDPRRGGTSNGRRTSVRRRATGPFRGDLRPCSGKRGIETLTAEAARRVERPIGRATGGNYPDRFCRSIETGVSDLRNRARRAARRK